MFKTSLLTAAVIAGFGLASGNAFADTYATAIFDKTYSMTSLRDNGQSRCDFGKEKTVENVRRALGRADFLNVKTFGASNELNSLTSGFKDVRGYTATNTQGIAFVNNIKNQLASISCSSGSTALGDAICASADELRAAAGAGDTLRMATVTDAGENSSATCGGNDYVNMHIFPKIVFTQPSIIFDISILSAEQGNVDSFNPNTKVGASRLEKADLNAGSHLSQLHSIQDEINALVNVAVYSGGEHIVIGDDDPCQSGCNPGDNDSDWGGDW